MNDYAGYRIGRYRPRNSGGGHAGYISVRHAIAMSNNIAAVQACQRAGAGSVVDLAKRMGVNLAKNLQRADSRRFTTVDAAEDVLKHDYSIALGSCLTSPLEMAGAFATFANGGDYARPMAIRAIYDAHGLRERNDPEVEQALLPLSAAADIDLCLKAVVSDGTGKSAGSVAGARGKTGTTSDNKDAWFVGYTKELSTAVWVASARYVTRNGEKRAVYEEMSSYTTGGHIAAPIWARFMNLAIPIQQRFRQQNGTVALPDENVRKLNEISRYLSATPRPDPTPGAPPLVDSAPPRESEAEPSATEEQPRRRRWNRRYRETTERSRSADEERPRTTRRRRTRTRTEDAPARREEAPRREPERSAPEPARSESTNEAPPPTETSGGNNEGGD
jgi:membrane peptidoglycan carboxypeptidase